MLGLLSPVMEHCIGSDSEAPPIFEDLFSIATELDEPPNHTCRSSMAADLHENGGAWLWID